MAIILLSQNIMIIQRNGAYKDVLLSNKCYKHSMDRIQSKDYRIGTYKLNNLFLFWRQNLYLNPVDNKKRSKFLESVAPI